MQQRAHVTAAVLCGALVLAGPGHGAVQLRILGEPATLAPAPQVINGLLVGAPESILGRLGCRVLTDDGALTIISPSGRRVVLRAGSDRLTVDGRDQAMPAEATVAGGKLICPLRPVLEAVGAIVRWDGTGGRLDVDTRISAIEVFADEEGARIHVRSELPTRARLGSVPGPERRYVDIPGAWLSELEYERTYVNLGALLRVRWGQFGQQPAVARIVADLREAQEARWEPAEDGLGGSMIVGQVEGDEPLIQRHLPTVDRILTQTPDADTTLVTVELSDPVPFEYDVLVKPPRVVLDLSDAAPTMPIAPVAVQSPFVATASLTGIPGQGGATLTLGMRQLVHFEVVESDTPAAVTIIFRRGRLADKRIVIDPGHGGRDSGARGRTLLEKEINLDVARRVAALLIQAGAQTVLTRESDVFVDLYDRPRLANRIGADLFVSIHCNAMPKPNTGRGTETYYYHMHSKCLGQVMHAALVRALGRRDNGLRWANFCVTRESEMPAVLVELMYLNTDEEEALLRRPEVRAAAAAAICEGLRQYVEGTGTAQERLEMGQ
ncbi:MAG: N-acetylmuramoyl-L-alanine amidase [Armatimonadota bacterium]